MKITVTFRHMEPTKALKEYAEEKIQRVQKYYSKPVVANVVLSVEKINHLAQVTLAGKGLSLKVAEQTDDMYTSIDKVIDKVERSLKRQNEKVKEHKSHVSLKEVGLIFTEETDSTITFKEKGAPCVVKKEKYEEDEITMDEAIQKLNKVGGDFFIFTDIESGFVSVVHNIDGKTVGLITPNNLEQESQRVSGENNSYSVLNSKDYFLGESTLEESLDALKSKKGRFVVYTDNLSSDVKVLYVKRDGVYGLIEER